jgi:hypothetical protein
MLVKLAKPHKHATVVKVDPERNCHTRHGQHIVTGISVNTVSNIVRALDSGSRPVEDPFLTGSAVL